MTKHFIGFIVFSLIITAAIIIKPFSFITKKYEYTVRSDYDYSERARSSCWRMKRQATESDAPNTADSGRVQIRQAVLDWNSKRMDWEIYNPKSFSTLALHLFVKDSKGVRYITTEVTPYLSSNNDMKYSSTYTFRDLRPSENLYVVPEVISRTDADRKNFFPVFDKNLAVPVTVLDEGNTYTVSND